MTTTTKKRVFFSILLLAAAGLITGYMLWNKSHFSIKNADPAAIISANELQQTFSTDSVTAKNKFIGDENNKKVIEVNGLVTELKQDQKKQDVILLKTATDGAFINCTFEEKITGIKVGDNIVLKGMCTGYNFDADMGIPGDVVLVRCYLIKNKN
ncbi:MAG: hypothetical protein ABJA78_14015 [Ferruginibacter sp.]